MSARYTVYCKQSAALVTPEQLLAGTRANDLRTIAENYDIPDESVSSAMRQLRIEITQGPGFHTYLLCFRPEGVRQVEIERWQTPGEVQAVAAEVAADLEATAHPALNRIRAHLLDTVDIISASFGSSKEEMFGMVLASEVVRWFAEKYEGIIRDSDGLWWELGKRYAEYQRLRP